LDLKNDIRKECEKYGVVRKVMVFDVSSFGFRVLLNVTIQIIFQNFYHFYLKLMLQKDYLAMIFRDMRMVLYLLALLKLNLRIDVYR
jgi:hypothetical protein